MLRIGFDDCDDVWRYKNVEQLMTDMTHNLRHFLIRLKSLNYGNIFSERNPVWILNSQKHPHREHTLNIFMTINIQWGQKDGGMFTPLSMINSPTVWFVDGKLKMSRTFGEWVSEYSCTACVSHWLGWWDGTHLKVIRWDHLESGSWDELLEIGNCRHQQQ